MNLYINDYPTKTKFLQYNNEKTNVLSYIFNLINRYQ